MFRKCSCFYFLNSLSVCFWPCNLFQSRPEIALWIKARTTHYTVFMACRVAEVNVCFYWHRHPRHSTDKCNFHRLQWLLLTVFKPINSHTLAGYLQPQTKSYTKDCQGCTQDKHVFDCRHTITGLQNSINNNSRRCRRQCFLCWSR